jgi:poly(ADP-ribose) glycohydrolase ARH3
MQTSTATLSDRFAGCLLGLAVGDGLGAPYEGLAAQDIYNQVGTPDVIATNPRGETLYFTDDTLMTMGVAETLLEHGRIEGAELMKAFVAHYHPDRGYGKGARQIIGAAIEGGDWRAVAETVFLVGRPGRRTATRSGSRRRR